MLGLYIYSITLYYWTDWIVVISNYKSLIAEILTCTSNYKQYFSHCISKKELFNQVQRVLGQSGLWDSKLGKLSTLKCMKETKLQWQCSTIKLTWAWACCNYNCESFLGKCSSCTTWVGCCGVVPPQACTRADLPILWYQWLSCWFYWDRQVNPYKLGYYWYQIMIYLLLLVHYSADIYSTVPQTLYHHS